MTSSFRHLKRGECPICSGSRKDCRQSTRTGLYHCRDDSVKSVQGFRFIKQDALGFNMWAVDDGRERNEAEWEAKLWQRAAERERQRKSEAEHLAQLLSVEERDHNIRKIHAQLGLTTRHRQNLRDRRLTDAEIDAGKFFSIAPWQEVTGINPRLAGVDLYGRDLTIGQPGFACPIWDTDEHIIGWQTRFDDATDNKYRWPTSQSKKRPLGATAHLQNGELPITCCRPVDGVKRLSISLAEGFLKPYIAAQRLNQIVLGAAGGNFWGSPQQLKAYLDALKEELGTKTVDLYPDGGAIANKTVMGHYERTIQMVTAWEYEVRVAWWGQEDKSHPDIDELVDLSTIAYLTPEEFLQLGERSKSWVGHSFSELFGWLPRFKQWLDLQSKTPWGFGRLGEVEFEQTLPAPPAFEYEAGVRRHVWQVSHQEGYRHILDTSATGIGKSFDAGLLTPEMFEKRQIIYVSAEHRNPTTPTLKVWPDLEARHKGLYRDEFGKLRRVDKDQPYVVAPNCGRNETISALRAKNVNGADTAGLVCKTCPYLEPCRAGAVFGFLHDRMEALQKPRLRAHPASLPSPHAEEGQEPYDYSNVVLVWEEASEILKRHRSLEVTEQDLNKTIAQLALKSPQAWDALRPVLNLLHEHLCGQRKQPNKFGWKDEQLREVLPSNFNIDIDAVREALKPDLGILNPTAEYGVDTADLRRSERKKFTASDSSTAEQININLALNWLPAFLSVLLGHEIGALRIQYGTLTITVGEERLADIAQAAACNIYLDATATAEDIARPLGLVDTDQIAVMQQRLEPNNNLEVIQVLMGQRLGINSRRQDSDGNDTFLQKRIYALIDQIQANAPNKKLAASDFKCHTKKGDGLRHHWADTRGVNDLEDYDVLVLVGIMCRTLSDLEAEFTVLYGRSPQSGTEKVKYPVQVNGELPEGIQPWFEMEVSVDPEFRAFVRRRILADIHQAIGRLRAHRRPEKQLKVYILGDYPLDIPVTLKKASDITLEAATKVERASMAFLGAAQKRMEAGLKVTQQAIADMTGYSRQHVARFWKLLKALLDNPNSKMSKTGSSPPDPGEAQWISNEYLPLLAKEPPAELLSGVLGVFEAYGRGVFQSIWDATPALAQIKILQALFLTLPSGQLIALAQSGYLWAESL